MSLTLTLRINNIFLGWIYCDYCDLGFPGFALGTEVIYIYECTVYKPLFPSVSSLCAVRYLCTSYSTGRVSVRELIRQEELKPQALQSYVLFIHSEIVLYEFSSVGQFSKIVSKITINFIHNLPEVATRIPIQVLHYVPGRSYFKTRICVVFLFTRNII